MSKIYLRSFRGGLNKGETASQIANAEVAELNNVLWRQGKWVKRPGYTNIAPTGNSDDIIEFIDYLNRATQAVTLLAGSTTNIYKAAGGVYTTRFTTGATRTTNDKWWFTEFQDASIATNGVDGIVRSANPDTTNYTAINFTVGEKNITQAKVILSLNQRLFLFNTTDATDGAVGNRMQYTNVNTYDSVDNTNFLDCDWTHSEILAAMPLANRIIAIYTQDSVGNIVDTGANPNFVSKFFSGNGIIGKKALTYHPLGHFYVSFDGFYIFRGGQLLDVGTDKIIDEYFNTVSQTWQHNTYCWTDRFNKEIHIGYSTSAEQPDREIVWNYAKDMWSTADIDAYVGAHRYRNATTVSDVYGASGGIGRARGGTTDNGVTINTALTTKAMYGNIEYINPLKETPYEYIQIGYVETDAEPTGVSGATVAVLGSDIGHSGFTTLSSNTIKNIGGELNRADVYGADHYHQIRVTDFDSISEITVDYEASKRE